MWHYLGFWKWWICFLNFIWLRTARAWHGPFQIGAELILLWALGGRDCAVATLTILKFSGRSQLIAMALNFAQLFMVWSPLFKKYKTIIVTQLLHVELLNIFNFLVKFISGRRFLPFVYRRCENALFCWILNSIAKMNY